MCHQTVSLVARFLEEHGIPTVILGSALDIVTHCAVPRYLFTDFPLGNPCGAPDDADMQDRIVRSAVDLFETASEPMTVVRSAELWPHGDAWRLSYAQVRPEDRQKLLAAGEKRRAERAAKAGS